MAAIEGMRSTEETLVQRLREVTRAYDFSTLVSGVNGDSAGKSDEVSRLFGRGIETVAEPAAADLPPPAHQPAVRALEGRLNRPVMASAAVAFIVSLAVSLAVVKLNPGRGAVVYADRIPASTAARLMVPTGNLVDSRPQR